MCGGRGLGTISAALPFARLYGIGGRRRESHNDGPGLVSDSRPDELLRHPFVQPFIRGTTRSKPQLPKGNDRCRIGYLHLTRNLNNPSPPRASQSIRAMSESACAMRERCVRRAILGYLHA
jgi:hypothetical protein